MVGNWLFKIACILGIFFSSICLIMSIVEDYPIICTFLYFIVLCLWIPKFNISIINKIFKEHQFLYFIIAFIVSFSLMALSTNMGEKSKDYSSETTEQQTKISQDDLLWFAKSQCEKEVKARVAYPPSAKISFREDNYIKDNSYTLYGTVDSQNKYGAMERKNFGCEIIIDRENDKFWIKDLIIE